MRYKGRYDTILKNGMEKAAELEEEIMKKKWKGIGLVLIVMAISISWGGAETGKQINSGVEEIEIEGMEESLGNGQRTQADPTDKIGAGQSFLIAIQKDNLVSNYEENRLTQLLENDLDVNLDFVFLPSEANQQEAALSKMITGGEKIPDIVIAQNLTQETILEYGANGVFLALDAYVEDENTAKYFSQIPKESREKMLQAMRSADGHIYAMAHYSEATWNQTPYRYYINKSWLDTLGLEVPTTTKELHQVLTAFVNEDPNGNGKKDEIGIYGQVQGTYGENVLLALINSFVFCNPSAQTNYGLALNQDGSTVIAPFTTREWKDALQYLHQLYEEGLIDPSIFYNTSDEFTQLLNQKENVVGLVTTGSYQVTWPDSDHNKNFLEMEMIRPFVGPNGICYTPYEGAKPQPIAYITSACENPDIAFRILDYFYKENISRSARWGEEGIDWSSDPQLCSGFTNGYVEAGLADGIRLTVLNDIWPTPQTHHWRNMNPYFESLEESNSNCNIWARYDSSSKSAPLNARNVEWYLDRKPEFILPELHYTEEELNQIGDSMEQVSFYVNTATMEFVTGERDIAKEWGTYLEGFEKIGLYQWIRIAQKAYEREIS